MHPTRPLAALLTAASFGLSAGLAHAADVTVGVTIGVTPPPIVLAPPPLVVVPGTSVHHVPSASFNLFVHAGRYYSFHNGAWFVAAGHRAPWTAISIQSLPSAIRAVPATHYKIPPGHAKKQAAGPGGSWCPPGQAKKGRC
jgi:hypothetical protein